MKSFDCASLMFIDTILKFGVKVLVQSSMERLGRQGFEEFSKLIASVVGSEGCILRKDQ